MIAPPTVPGRALNGLPQDVADLCWSILWVIVPSLVFFVALPAALRAGIAFWPSLVLACGGTALSYAIWIWAGRRAGLDL